MDALKKKFEKLHAQYIEQKPALQAAVERWYHWRKGTFFKQSKRLLDEVERCDQEIIALLETKDWHINKALLRIKVETFRRLFKEVRIATRSYWKTWIEAILVIIIGTFIARNFVVSVHHISTPAAQPTLLVGDRVMANRFVYVVNKPQVGDIVMFEHPDFEYDQSRAHAFWQRYFGFAVPLFNLPGGPEYIVKRVIAAPGDTIEGKLENERPALYRNGEKLDEPYINTFPLLALKKKVGLIQAQTKQALYIYDPKKDLDEQPFYEFDSKDILFDPESGNMRLYSPHIPLLDKSGVVADVFGPVTIPDHTYWLMGDTRRSSIDSREWGVITKQKIIGKVTHTVWSLDSEEPIWLFELIKRPFEFVKKIRVDRLFKRVE